MVKRIASYILLAGVYGFTWLVALLGRLVPRRRWRPTGRIMVTGTFFNPNWYLSHITPLVRSGAREVILVIDRPQQPLDGVRFVCPPQWLARVLSRAGAKTVWMLLAGIRYRPDLYMGYHLAPGACSALVVGSILGRPSCYQMTCGPVEFLGGGCEDIECVGRYLGRPSRFLEALAWAVVNSIDLIVVRGRKAREYLGARRVKGAVAVITGSVQCELQLSQPERSIHMAFVGRLAPVKQVDQFITIVKAISQTIPSVKAVIIGDGPLMQDLKTRVHQLGLDNNIDFLGKREDVGSILASSRTFVLTSQYEGLSIAMIEAMAAGAVPVVADIGELGDLVTHGESGYLIKPNCIEEYVTSITSLLQNHALWTSLSDRARETAAQSCDIEVISAKWQQHLGDAISRASNHSSSGVASQATQHFRAG